MATYCQAPTRYRVTTSADGMTCSSVGCGMPAGRMLCVVIGDTPRISLVVCEDCHQALMGDASESPFRPAGDTLAWEEGRIHFSM